LPDPVGSHTVLPSAASSTDAQATLKLKKMEEALA
jgi:hypothetical protein